MEEYVYLLGIPIYHRVPFSGLKGILESQVIAGAIHLKKYDVDANLTVKGGIRGLTSKFLIEKAFSFANVGSMVAFETIFSLLIYGSVLFPNIDNFVDVNVIRIFLVGNHVPTFLSDTYFSIHHRTSKGIRTIFCYVPLMYKWFISHLPQSPIFKENKGCLRWSKRLMSLTNDDTTWYSSVYEDVEIINSCREFSSVPLLGTQEGINYNLDLARHQLGFAIKGKPNNTLLEGLFFQEGKDTQRLKARMVHAWHNIHRKGKSKLGLKNHVALEPYTIWVNKRAKEFKMPYAYERSIYVVVVKSPIIHIEDIKELQEALDRMKQEKDAWKDKFHASNLKKIEL
ncbi:uncharacterized protein LOC127095848 [Lathyrus oleraceus]|uniref:uncharacterized protein LOC127095848 n=1 Tax=Pisum sativum TaxID=3888 RepID=UPI0021D3535B|nr:uncharacterized protein LOC127095848 [Pisum sativum]